MIDCSKTVNFLKENDRMCHSIINGSECGTSCLLSYENNGTYCGCNEFMLHYPEKAIAIVQKWSDEHPQRTYLSELLRTFPNVELNCNGTPKRIHCPHHLGLKDIDNCDKGFVECWNQLISIEDGEK